MRRELLVGAWIIHKGRLLIIKHRDTGLWLPPGGHAEKGETPKQAVIRELKEETNFDARPLCEFTHSEHQSNDHIHEIHDFLFLMNDINQMRLLEEEITDHKWVCEDELRSFKEPIIQKAKLAFTRYKVTKAL